MKNLRTAFVAVLLMSVSALGQPRAARDVTSQAQLFNLPVAPLNPPSATRGLNLPGANKIDPRLRNLLTAAGAERTERSISLGAAATGRLPIVIEATSIANVQQAEAAIRAQNGEVESDFENTIWARIPPAAVTNLSTLATVNSLLVQPDEQLRQEPGGAATRGAAVFGDGIKAAEIQVLHQRGITGKGVKIGILDMQFADYSKLLRDGRVKKPLATKTFGEVPTFESGGVHGTACAEIISAVAPDADLVLASFDGREGSMKAAADWLISQGVQIISYSMGSSMRPSDGSDTMSRYLDRTSAQNGVLWVVSAGNDGESHWMGWADPGNDAVIPVTADKKNQGIEVVSSTNHLRVVVRWDDWGPDPQKPSSSQDIDAYLLGETADGKDLEKVAESTDTQNGGASLPIEVLEVKGNDVAKKHFLVVLKANHVTRRVKVHVFVDQEDGAFVVFPAVATGSISSPASSRSALAVGAVDVLTKQLADYSSQGPTDDNRLKPEVSGPTNTISFAYAGEDGRFPGTSSSCPHVAGFAALLKQANPRITGPDLRTLVMQSVVPQGNPHPNSLYGYGEIDGAAARDAMAKNNPAPPPAPAPGPAPTPAPPPVPRPAPVPAPRPAPAPAPVTQTGPSIAVPAEFGGSVTLATISALRNQVNQPRDGLSVRLVSGRDLYRIGDGMKLGFQASDDCSCLLFVRDSQGKYSVFTPEESKYFMLRRGEPYLLPHAANETLEVTGPAGGEELLLVCASRPVNLNSAVSGGGAGGLAVASYSYVIEGKDP